MMLLFVVRAGYCWVDRTNQHFGHESEHLVTSSCSHFNSYSRLRAAWQFTESYQVP